MKNFVPTILGLDIGARQIGVAVLHDEELIFYGVKTFRKKNAEDSLNNLERILERLIAEHGIEFAAVEKIVFVQQHRAFVRIAYERAVSFVKSRRVPLLEYNPKLIRQIVCGGEKPTKRNAALILAKSYLELVRYFNVPRLWQKRYYAQLFDAIAAGVVCARKLKQEGHR